MFPRAMVNVQKEQTVQTYSRRDEPGTPRGDLAAVPRPASGISGTPSPYPPLHTLPYSWVQGAPTLPPVPPQGPHHLVSLKSFLLPRLQ